MDMAEIISTQNAPAAIGPYSQAVKANGMLYTSGQIGIVPATGELAEGGLAAQAEQVMKNLAAVFAAAGTGFEKAVKTTCYLADMADFAAFNEVYARYFGGQARPQLFCGKGPAQGRPVRCRGRR